MSFIILFQSSLCSMYCLGLGILLVFSRCPLVNNSATFLLRDLSRIAHLSLSCLSSFSTFSNFVLSTVTRQSCWLSALLVSYYVTFVTSPISSIGLVNSVSCPMTERSTISSGWQGISRRCGTAAGAEWVAILHLFVWP